MLLASYEKLDPSPNRQRALTPKFLRAYYHTFYKDPDLSSLPYPSSPLSYAQSVDLLLGGFFFAMRSCEYCITPGETKTRPITIGDVVFRGADRNKVIPISHKRLVELSHYVSVTFVAQKNGLKEDSRSQSRTTDPILCPVRRLASAVKRIYQNDPFAPLSTKLCSFGSGSTRITVTQSFMLHNIRFVCTLCGGKDAFGFSAEEIGNKSLRSGAAMSLSMNNYPADKIKILGRWKSDAFLDYIQPQILEWTTNAAENMTKPHHFRDITPVRAPDTPTHASLRSRRQSPHPFDGEAQYNLYFC